MDQSYLKKFFQLTNSTNNEGLKMASLTIQKKKKKHERKRKERKTMASLTDDTVRSTFNMKQIQWSCHKNFQLLEFLRTPVYLLG